MHKKSYDDVERLRRQVEKERAPWSLLMEQEGGELFTKL